MKKNALFFVLNGIGGAEKMTIEIAKMLISNGWNIQLSILCKKKHLDTSRIESFVPEQIVINKIVMKGQISLIRNLYNAIKSVKPAVVFASAMHINQRLLFISPLFRNTTFIVRNDNYLFTLSKLKRTTLSLTYNLADRIISQTEEMESELNDIGINTSKIYTFHNPINSCLITELANQQSPYLEHKETIFVAVGRLAYQKGFDFLLEAFSILQEKMPESKLYIVGEIKQDGGSVYDNLKRRITQLNLDSKVFFPGFQTNPYKYIKNADVYVLSSRYEGLPNTLIEAQFLGTPCAAFKCIPIIERIIKDGENGFLAEKEDVNSLAAAMLNASKLKSVVMSYKPAMDQDFIKLFNDTIES